LHRRHHAPHGLRQRLRHSLRWRLVLLFVLLALATSAVFLGGMRSAFSGGWRELVRPLLTDYVDRITADLGTPPSVDKARALTQRLPIAIRIDGPQVNWQSQPGRMPHFGNHDPVYGSSDGGWWPLQRTTADGHRIRYGLGDTQWERAPRITGWLTLAALLALTLAAYATVRHLFRPLDDIRDGALRYGTGDFSTPIPQRRRDELGDLAGQVNAMASGLQRMLQGQRELLLAISHELRSPLTRARLNAELVTEGPEREALLRDLALMGQLITDLLESERLAAGSAALRREDVDVNALARDVAREVAATQPPGAACAAGVQLQLDESLGTLHLDRTRLTLLLRNLLDNACRHGAGAGQPPQLSTRREGADWLLVVRDHGPGVPEEQLAQLGQAFYRPDSARTRAAGGVGLGLYLCRLVAQSHGGTLVLRNAQPGLEVTLRLPL
jgi:signal transduction histidine kinase